MAKAATGPQRCTAQVESALNDIQLHAHVKLGPQ